MKAIPCEQHNTWTDFPGGGPCGRCGWSEKAIEVHLLGRLLDNPTKYAGVRRPDALASLWKREMHGPGSEGFLVQPATEEDLEEFLRSTPATDKDDG